MAMHTCVILDDDKLSKDRHVTGARLFSNTKTTFLGFSHAGDNDDDGDEDDGCSGVVSPHELFGDNVDTDDGE